MLTHSRLLAGERSRTANKRVLQQGGARRYDRESIARKSGVTVDNDVLHISTDKHELDLDMIHAFLHDHAPWSIGIARHIVERSIEGSLCFGAYLGKRQVGFARVITDFVTFGYLCDVFVLPEFQSRGYAALLMQHVVDSDVLQGLRRIVLVTSNAHGLYRRYGFDKLAHPEKYMEVHRPNVYAAG
jgi:GNAT superfamily N-acetyltransferase